MDGIRTVSQKKERVTVLMFSTIYQLFVISDHESSSKINKMRYDYRVFSRHDDQERVIVFIRKVC